MTEESGNHGNHGYSFHIGERGDWARDLAEADYYELKKEFREDILELLEGAPEPLSYDLQDLASEYHLKSLHAIPDEVHRELLQGWLDGINRKRPRGEQLFLPSSLIWCCELVPPKLWFACAVGQLRVGPDEKQARDWEIEVTGPKSKTTKKIPVFAGASWNCEVAGAYRKRRNRPTWHWCSNCRSWPRVNYESSAMAPSKAEDLCPDCLRNETTGECTPAHFDRHGASAPHASMAAPRA